MDTSSTTVPSIVVYVTVPNREACKKLSESIVKEKLTACVKPKSVPTKPTNPKTSMKPKRNVTKSVVSPSKAKVDAKTKSKPAAKPKAKLSLVKPKKATALKPKAAAKAKKETTPKIKSRGECCRGCPKFSQT
jgi:CutA1 divalent ion tolerance protein